jgi:hypothetical protein
MGAVFSTCSWLCRSNKRNITANRDEIQAKYDGPLKKYMEEMADLDKEIGIHDSGIKAQHTKHLKKCEKVRQLRGDRGYQQALKEVDPEIKNETKRLMISKAFLNDQRSKLEKSIFKLKADSHEVLSALRATDMEQDQMEINEVLVKNGLTDDKIRKLGEKSVRMDIKMRDTLKNINNRFAADDVSNTEKMTTQGIDEDAIEAELRYMFSNDQQGAVNDRERFNNSHDLQNSDGIVNGREEITHLGGPSQTIGMDDQYDDELNDIEIRG